MKRYFYTYEVDPSDGFVLVFAFASKAEATAYCATSGAEIVKAKDITDDQRKTAQWQCDHVIGVHI